ncbi:aromatic prenyltransferase [Xylariaceae sp. FL1272]|nr:aromatic prenyltransferase [Xylariaceae sp. FL1272]
MGSAQNTDTWPGTHYQEFWRQYANKPLAEFLKGTGVYTPEQQESHLRFLNEFIVPRVGPAPGIPSLWTYHGSPFEFSVNLSDAGEPFVRFVFDPVGGDIGDVEGPLPKETLDAMLPGLVQATTKTDLRWFHQIHSWLALEREEIAAVRAEWSMFPRVPQIFMAMDLHGGERSMKAYMFPTSKSTATGISTHDITFNNLRRLEPYGDQLEPALRAIEEYIPQSLEPLVIDCLALDCVDPKTARVKIYTQAKLNTFRSVEHVLTYGGKVRDETTLKGVEAIRKIWPLILNEPRMEGDDDFQAPVVDPDNRYKTLSYSWECRPGQALPDLKIYIHLWLHARDNQTMLGNWEKIFKVNGWKWGTNGEFRFLIENAYGKEYTTADTQVIHTCASLQYTAQKGVYMTVYTSPPVPKVEK